MDQKKKDRKSRDWLDLWVSWAPELEAEALEFGFCRLTETQGDPVRQETS